MYGYKLGVCQVLKAFGMKMCSGVHSVQLFKLDLTAVVEQRYIYVNYKELLPLRGAFVSAWHLPM